MNRSPVSPGAKQTWYLRTSLAVTHLMMSSARLRPRQVWIPFLMSSQPFRLTVWSRLTCTEGGKRRLVAHHVRLAVPSLWDKFEWLLEAILS